MKLGPVHTALKQTEVRFHSAEVRSTCLFKGWIKINPCTLTCVAGKILYCGVEHAVESLYLPLGDELNNYILTVEITVTNAAGVAVNSTETTWVCSQVCLCLLM